MYKWCSTNANVIFVFLKNFRKDIFVYDFMLRDYIEGMFSFILFCKTKQQKSKDIYRYRYRYVCVYTHTHIYIFLPNLKIEIKTEHQSWI